MHISRDTRQNVESITSTQPKSDINGLTLILGGARSGKSSLAVETAARSVTEVVFIATAQAFDSDMEARISRHRQERPQWHTIEQPLNLLEAVKQAPQDSCLIIDCLTLWISNLILRGDREDAIKQTSTEVLAVIACRSGRTIAVSNEVGLGIVPDSQLGREYREVLGRINQQWVSAAQLSLFMVAGKALLLQNTKDLIS